MDGRVGGYLKMDALWTQGRWWSRNLGIFADIIYLRSKGECRLVKGWKGPKRSEKTLTYQNQP